MLAMTENLGIGIAKLLQREPNDVISFELLDDNIQRVNDAIMSDISEALTYSDNSRVQKRYTNALLIGFLVFIFIVIIIYVLKKLFGIKVIS